MAATQTACPQTKRAHPTMPPRPLHLAGIVAAGTALALCLGCGGQPPSRPAPPASEPAEVGDDRVAADPRDLALDATFADLLTRATQLDAALDPGPDGGPGNPRCLLDPGQPGRPHRFAADVGVAIRPVPEAAADLDDRAMAPASILTPYGRFGVGEGLVLATFTTFAPLGPTTGQEATLLLLTDRGLHARALLLDPPVAPPTSGSAPADLVHWIEESAATLPAGGLVVVTAEAAMPISSLARLLAALPASSHVVLAVPLGSDVRLPAAVANRLPGAADVAAHDDASLCPDGLPPPPDPTPEGALPTQVLRDALLPLGEAGRTCVANLGAAAAGGGRIVLHLRIGASGVVAEACVHDDAVGDGGLRRCLLDAARQIPFPAPEPSGIVEVALPVVVSAAASLDQRPICGTP